MHDEGTQSLGQRSGRCIQRHGAGTGPIPATMSHSLIWLSIEPEITLFHTHQLTPHNLRSHTSPHNTPQIHVHNRLTSTSRHLHHIIFGHITQISHITHHTLHAIHCTHIRHVTPSQRLPHLISQKHDLHITLTVMAPKQIMHWSRHHHRPLGGGSSPEARLPGT